MFADKGEESVNPFLCFGIYAILQGLFLIAAFFMNSEMEPGAIDGAEQDAVLQQSSLLGDANRESLPKSNWSLFMLNIELIYEALRNPEIYKVILFFGITGCIIPSYEDA